VVLCQASKRFWKCFDALPSDVQALSKKNFKFLKQDLTHPSLQFKLIGGKLYSARVGLYYRVLGLPRDRGVHGLWIGTHGEYDKLIGG
jgi:hypothetical protein